MPDALRASPSGSRRWSTWGRVAVTVGVMVALGLSIDLERVAQLVRGVGPGFIVVLVAVALARMPIAAARMHVLVAARRPVAFGELIRQSFVGAYFNNLLPTSIGGDVARVLMLGRCGWPHGEAATYVLMERLLGAAALVALALIASFVIPVGGAIRLTIWALVASGIALVVAALWLRSGSLHDRLRDTAIGRMAEAARDLLMRPARLALGFVLSLIFQVTSVSLSYVTALALDLPLSFWSCLALVPLVWLATLLPISVGGVGVREASFIALLATVGLDREESLLISLGTYAALLVTGAVGGLVLVGTGGREWAESGTPVE